MVYQVSHLPLTHSGLRVAILSMAIGDACPGVMDSVCPRANEAFYHKRVGEWYLRRICEADILHHACICIALAAQGR